MLMLEGAALAIFKLPCVEGSGKMCFDGEMMICYQSEPLGCLWLWSARLLQFACPGKTSLSWSLVCFAEGKSTTSTKRRQLLVMWMGFHGGNISCLSQEVFQWVQLCSIVQVAVWIPGLWVWSSWAISMPSTMHSLTHCSMVYWEFL